MIERIFKSLPRYSSEPGLSRIQRFIRENDVRPDGFTVIIGGTNGKGSVAALLENVLIRAGIPVGAMKSPHVYDPGERITYNGIPITRPEFSEILRYTLNYYEKIMESPTFADILTASALLYFSRYRVPRVLILEVGIGGDLDPVNGVDGNLTVITNIGHDHSDLLGPYPRSIAERKSGIVRKNVPLVTGEKNPEALEVFREVCRKSSSQLIIAPESNLLDLTLEGTRLSCCGETFTIGIPGVRQAENGGILREIVKLLPGDFTISSDAFQEGAKATKLPWRLEPFSFSPPIIFDGAHNRESWENLARSLKYLPHGSLQVLLAIQKSKQPLDFPRTLSDKKVILHLPRMKDSRYYSAEDLRSHLKDFSGTLATYSSVKASLEMILSNLHEKDMLLCTGSFGKASKIRKTLTYLLNHSTESSLARIIDIPARSISAIRINPEKAGQIPADK